MNTQEQRRAKFEQAVIDRMKESGYLEVEIRVECLQRHGDGYYDGSIDAYWHFWNAAMDSMEVELPDPRGYDVPMYADQPIKDCREAIEAVGGKVKP